VFLVCFVVKINKFFFVSLCEINLELWGVLNNRNIFFCFFISVYPC